MVYDQTINMFGEKTSEQLLSRVAFETASEEKASIVDFSVYADAGSDLLRYVYFIEFAEDLPIINKTHFQEKMELKLRTYNFLYDCHPNQFYDVKNIRLSRFLKCTRHLGISKSLFFIVYCLQALIKNNNLLSFICLYIVVVIN